MHPNEVRSLARRGTLVMWMASSLALTACGDADLEAASTQDVVVVEQSGALEVEGLVADRRIIVYLTGSQSLYAVQDGKPTMIAQRSGAPSVSPDGREVVYAKLPDSWKAGDAVTRTELHVYNVKNGKDDKLTSGHDDQDPSWTPDGKRILFQSKKRSGLSSFWSVKANGKDLDQLTNAGCTQTNDPAFVPTPASSTGVQWAPNDRRIIVYFTSQTSDSEVRVMSFNQSLGVASAYSLGKGTSPKWTERGTVTFLRTVNGGSVEVEVSVQ
ncbi:PD40 domain-containing protein [Myxococcus sp. CA056]|nr:PD40 domain-containing protein [Myxococcus sp. CA056]NTX39634.1 PD40 domain-containing protein [Myxococcus sp. CA033]